MNKGIKLGKGLGRGVHWQVQDEGELIKGKRLLSQAEYRCGSTKEGEGACFSAIDLQQEAHRGNSGGSPLSKCDGHFNSQIDFSSLAHALVPPPLLAVKLIP